MSQQEGRRHVQLREIFEEAYTAAIPFLDPAQGFAGQPLIRHAYIQLHEMFPALSQQEIAILVPALQRTFAERNKAR